MKVQPNTDGSVTASGKVNGRPYILEAAERKDIISKVKEMLSDLYGTD